MLFARSRRIARHWFAAVFRSWSDSLLAGIGADDVPRVEGWGAKEGQGEESEPSSRGEAPAHWLARATGSPPAHWAEHVRRAAPELLQPSRMEPLALRVIKVEERVEAKPQLETSAVPRKGHRFLPFLSFKSPKASPASKTTDERPPTQGQGDQRSSEAPPPSAVLQGPQSSNLPWHFGGAPLRGKSVVAPVLAPVAPILAPIVRSRSQRDDLRGTGELLAKPSGVSDPDPGRSQDDHIPTIEGPAEGLAKAIATDSSRLGDLPPSRLRQPAKVSNPSGMRLRAGRSDLVDSYVAKNSFVQGSRSADPAQRPRPIACRNESELRSPARIEASGRGNQALAGKELLGPEREGVSQQRTTRTSSVKPVTRSTRRVVEASNADQLATEIRDSRWPDLPQPELDTLADHLAIALRQEHHLRRLDCEQEGS